MNHLLNSLAVVSGGSHGIGRAVVEQLAAEGGRVVNIDTREQQDHHPQVSYYGCDVREKNDVEQFSQWLEREFGAPRILVLNAGVGVHEKLTEGDPEKWQRVLDTNIMGPLRLIRALVPAMIAQGQGHVVFISSVSANRSFPYGAVYSASKTALEVIAETLRLEVGTGLNVSVVSPGTTATNFFEHELQGGRSLQEFGAAVLTPQSVAEQVMHCLRLEGGVVITKLITRPQGQQF